MRIAIHYLPHLSHHREWGEIFAAGLRAHGIEPQFVNGQYPVDCDLAVFWSHHKRWQPVIDLQLRNGLNYLVMERGYFGDRLKWTALGYNGQNGRANFCNQNSPADRWERYRWSVEAWNPGSEHILLIGQVPTDSAVDGINFEQWVKTTTARLAQITDLPVKFRPHPLTVNRGLNKVSYRTRQRDLVEDLAGAACVVTYNSTTAVDAVFEGKPVIALDPRSMAWPVAGHHLEDVLNPPLPDRTQWFHDLAYCQWTRREISSGAAWEHLKAGPQPPPQPPPQKENQCAPDA